MKGGAQALVIGVGNEYRGDDAAGLFVARRVREVCGPDIDVIEATGEGGRLIDAWSGYAAVIIVDAMRSSSLAGTVRRVDATTQPVPAYFRHRSTHAVGVVDAVEVARVMGRLPDRVVLYGVEGKAYEAGAALSPEVEAALPRVVEAVISEAVALMELMEAHADA
jgi:hydrogenase maturation protease